MIKNSIYSIFYLIILSSIISCKQADPKPIDLKQSDLLGPTCTAAYSYINYHLLAPLPSDCKSCHLEWTYPADARLVSQSGAGIRLQIGKMSGQITVKMVSNSGESNIISLDLKVDSLPGTYSYQLDINDFQNGFDGPQAFMVNGKPYFMGLQGADPYIRVYSYDINNDQWTNTDEFKNEKFAPWSKPIEINHEFYFITTLKQLYKFNPNTHQLNNLGYIPINAGLPTLFYSYNQSFYMGNPITGSSMSQDKYIYSYNSTINHWDSAYKNPSNWNGFDKQSESIEFDGKWIFVLRNNSTDGIFLFDPSNQNSTQLGSMSFNNDDPNLKNLNPRGLFRIGNKILAMGRNDNKWIDPINNMVTDYVSNKNIQCPIIVNSRRRNTYFSYLGNCFFVGGINPLNYGSEKDVLRFIP